MAESQILGLFATPAQVQRQEQERLRQQSQMYSDPIAQQMYQGVGMLTSGIGNLLGAPSEQMRRAQTTQNVLANTAGEIGSPQYYRDLANNFRQQGMVQSALAAAQKAKTIEDEIQGEAEAKYGSISFKDYGSKAVDIRRLIGEISRTTDPAKKTVLQQQLEDAFKAGAKEVSDAMAAEAGAQERAKLDEQRRDNAMKTVQQQFEQANIQDSTVFNIRQRIIKEIPNINTGFGANAITGFQAMARQFGLVEDDSRWAELSSNTQSAQAIIGQLMLEQIKTLGTNPSNADREFLMKTLPDVTNEPDAIRRIADFIEAKAIFLREDARAKLKHLENNKDLTSYETPKEIYDKLERFYEEADVASSRAPMTDEELMERPAVIRDVEAPEQPEPPVGESTEMTTTPEGSIPAPTANTQIAQAIAAYQTNPMVQNSATLNPADPQVLAGLRQRLENMSAEELQNFTDDMVAQGGSIEAATPAEGGAVQVDAVIDQIVTQTLPSNVAGERVANMSRREKLQRTMNYLQLKLQTQGLSPSESKLLNFVEAEFVNSLGPQ